MKIVENLAEKAIPNQAYHNIISRVSVRKFTNDPVTDDELTAILYAAMSAPSGVNKQPWEFIVIDEPELLKELSSALPYAKMTEKAPVAIIVCGNKERMLPGADANLWEQDCSAASENILLAAHSLGLGGVWTCLYPHEDRIEPVKKILNIDDNLIPFNLIPIGHPETDHSPMDKWKTDRIHFNRLK